MSATADAVTRLRAGESEPLRTRVFAFATAVLLAITLWLGRESLAETFVEKWPELLFWALLVAILNVFPLNVPVQDVQLVLDMPLLLATAFLYPVGAAALIPLVGMIDVREFRGEVNWSRGLFNRCQASLVVVLAGLTFQSLAEGLSLSAINLFATLLALVVFDTVNTAFVAVFSSMRRKGSVREISSALHPGTTFWAVYAGYGVLALVMAQVFSTLGAWSVAAFLAPLLVARQALHRQQRLEKLTAQVVDRERLLERTLSRMDDERKDERSRIASDLHDEALQALITLLMRVRELSVDGPGAWSARSTLEPLTEGAVDSLRGVIGDLRRSPLGRGGLVPTLRSLVGDLELDWRVNIDLMVADQLGATPDQQLAAYQVAREGLINAVKHSDCSAIEVDLSMQGGTLIVRITDDGRGFNPAEVDRSSHFGLGLLEERVKHQGGELKVTSGEGAGTLLIATLPPRPKI